MAKENNASNNEDTTRRDLLAGLLSSVAELVEPKDAKADVPDVTKNDVAKVSFEIEKHKKYPNLFERTKNKTSAVGDDATDDQYPDAKAIYAFTKDYIDTAQGKDQYSAEKEKALFVNNSGLAYLTDYNVDDEFREDSSNPVQNQLLYGEIKDLREYIVFDEKPAECKAEECEKEAAEKEHKHISYSSGIYHTYQETEETTSLDVESLKMGVNYAYTGTKVAGTDSGSLKWGVNLIDVTPLAVCEDDKGALYAGNKESVFRAPSCVWHT